MTHAASRAPLLEVTDDGLYCRAGDFWIDPWRPVDRAVVTHAHADHARPGSRAYLGAEAGRGVLRTRLGPDATLELSGWGEIRRMNGVAISLHPAGHILGSAQVRVEHGGEVWVVTGDYKRRTDPTTTPFESLRCHTLVTESTFGLPVYRWPDPDAEMREVARWWASNRAAGRTSILFGYSLGKAQRLLAGLPRDLGPILVHGAVARLNESYRAAGVDLPDTLPADLEHAKLHRGRAMVVAPPSAGGTPWLRKFGAVSTAFASGWMRIRGTRRRRSGDRGFVISDHADWDALLTTVRESGAERVGVTHGYRATLVRYLREVEGLDAWALPTPWEDRAESEAESQADSEADSEVASEVDSEVEA
ncbi:ligase-associated DNA damage response exonuclease [Gaopeijia maritima]|uniref:Ligase-associated DNA damage response exonuclease n=1 Tax=Gaopeijia maritima TaxID=3119007 RepID=A0ABU9E6C3_9BACT